MFYLAAGGGWIFGWVLRWWSELICFKLIAHYSNVVVEKLISISSYFIHVSDIYSLMASILCTSSEFNSGLTLIGLTKRLVLETETTLGPTYMSWARTSGQLERDLFVAKSLTAMQELLLPAIPFAWFYLMWARPLLLITFFCFKYVYQTTV